MATATDILGVHRNGKIPARWSRHYQRLCAERDRLEARDCCSAETAPVKLDDLTDSASDDAEMNLSMVAVSATKDTIFEVVAAIRRIERGTYGICEMTGEPIEAERLTAIPWTRYSLGGQRQLEAAGQARKHGLPRLQSFNEPVPGEVHEQEAEGEALS